MERNPQYVQAIRSVKGKLEACKVRPETIVHHCERLDKRKQEILHKDDVEDVIRDLLGPEALTLQEMKFLLDSVSLPSSKNKDKIEYKRFIDVLSQGRGLTDDSPEKWRDEEDLDAERNRNQEESFRRGTVGEFLVNAACVAEQRNYKLLMSVLDKFERESGMRINVSKEGLIIPLGPDLQATLNISLRP